ncbi:MAG: DUF5677 domain-containing protein [Saprospiraceae bacterium]
MTKPIYDLHPEHGEVFAEYGNLLEEIVNFGTHILSWDIDRAKGGDEHLPVFLIFRNILEHMDAISILIRKSSVEPCKNLLRVMFESIMNLEYMLETDTKRRGLAFLISGYHAELKFIEKISKGTVANHQLKQKFKADKSMPALPPITVAGMVEQAALIETMLKLDVYKEVESEYRRLVATGKNNPPWYQLFGGPPNIDQLATRISRQGLYEVFYRAWSATVHGHNVVKGNVTNGTDAGIAQIRHPKDAKQVALHAANLTLILFHLFITKRVSSEMPKFRSWYKSVQAEIVKLR